MKAKRGSGVLGDDLAEVVERHVQLVPTPEVEMWTEVLKTVVRDSCGTCVALSAGDHKALLISDARMFFIAGTFRPLCRKLGIHPEWMRNLLRDHTDWGVREFA